MLVGPNVGSSFGLKSFIDERRTFLLTELSALGCFPSTINNVTNNSTVIYPNPSTGFLTIICIRLFPKGGIKKGKRRERKDCELAFPCLLLSKI